VQVTNFFWTFSFFFFGFRFLKYQPTLWRFVKLHKIRVKRGNFLKFRKSLVIRSAERSNGLRLGMDGNFMTDVNVEY